MMAERVYSSDEAYTAMCIIEEIIQPNYAGTPWQDTRDNVGIRELRNMVLDILAGPCHDAFERAFARWEKAHKEWLERRGPRAGYVSVSDTDPAPEEPGAFDYEFVPFWLRNCVDWSGDQPRVRGSAHNGAQETA